MQLTADIFGLPASRPSLYEASGLGAAIDGMVGAKIHPDFKTAVAEMTRIGETFEPNPKHHEIYNRFYNEIYTKMYSRLRPMYTSIRDILRQSR